MNEQQDTMTLFRSGSRYFPEDFRAFANGPLAVCLDRFGGVDSIRLLEVMDFQGSFYPDRASTDLFSRNGTCFNDVPFGGPAAWFGILTKDGAYRYCDTTNPAVGPSFCKASGFEMLLNRDSLSIRIRLGQGNQGMLVMDAMRYFHQTGKKGSCMNQCAHWHESWLTAEQRGSDFKPELPFLDQGVTISRHDPVFKKEINGLVFQIEREYSTGSRPLWAVITASSPLTFSIPQERWVLQSKPIEGIISYGIGFGRSEKEALTVAVEAIRNHDDGLSQVSSAQRFNRMITFPENHLPGADIFARLYPFYQSAAVIHETADKLAFRAAQDKYGLFMMWDHIYPCRDFLLMGVPEKAEKGLRFAVEYPHVDTSMMIPLQLVPAVNELLAFLPESDLVENYLPFYRRFFDFTCRWCDEKTGLLANYLCLAVDFPEHAGLQGLYYEAGMNGMWYNTCRCLENFAIMASDVDMERKARTMAAKIEKSYLKVFFDPQEGFLRTALLENGSYPQHEIYLYTNTWGLDYVHGLRLYGKVAAQLADYQNRRLHHPWGHVFMSMVNGLPGSSSVSEHMNQHLGHECTCSRLGNRVDEVQHVMRGYMDIFKRFRNAVETFNYYYCAGDQTQRADWQTFSATAAMQGLIHGILGIYWHRGGLFYLQADDNQKRECRNFHFRNACFDYTCLGQGGFVEKFTVDGQEILGTLQIPADLKLSEDRTVPWIVQRSKVKPCRPVLLYALDAPVAELHSEADSLSFRIMADVHAPVCIQTAFPCVVAVNGQVVDAETHEDGQMLIDLKFNANDFIEVTKR